MPSPDPPSPAPGPRPRRRGRIVLAAGALLAALLLAEGVLSLGWGRSLRGLLGAGFPPLGLPAVADRERLRAAAGNPGPYVVHPDPRVRYVFRPEAALRILDVPFRTNRLGLRRRPPPPPSPAALRVVVLGDSVAFGVGVGSDETLAAHLEGLLGGPARAAVWTVAVPGWNCRNAVHALLDFWDVYRPRIVIYLPVGNDLSDTDDVYATGHRRVAPDPLAPEPLLTVSQSANLVALSGLARRLLCGGRQPAAVRPGADALTTDLGPESRRRYRENACTLAFLAARLRRRGARLLVLFWEMDRYAWLLWDHLLREGGRPPCRAGFREVPPWMRLPGDPHLSAPTLRVLAALAAGELRRREWAAAPPPPPPPPRYQPFLLPPPSAQEVARRAAALRREARARLESAVDFRTGRGAYQIYGGLLPGGRAGPRLALLLRRRGNRLGVRLAPLASRPDLYPLAVTVRWNGREVGRLRLTAGRTAAAAFPVPPGGELGDVLLAADHWGLVTAAGESRVAAYRPLRIGWE